MAPTHLSRVLVATGLADTANGLFTVAAVVTTAQTSGGSGALVAAVTAASTLPWLLFAIPAGMLVDSVSRRTAMIYANLARGCLMLSAAAAVAVGISPVPVLVIAVFLVTTMQTIVDTAAEALVPALVRAERLSRTNGALAVATRISHQFLGPMLAGVLVAVGRPAAALAAGTTCMLAAAVLHPLATSPPQLPVAHRPRRRATFRTGLVTVRRSPVLLTLVLVGAVTTCRSVSHNRSTSESLAAERSPTTATRVAASDGDGHGE